MMMIEYEASYLTNLILEAGFVEIVQRLFQEERSN